MFSFFRFASLLLALEINMNREITSDKILRMRTVLERTGLSRSTVYRKVQDGTFPPKVKISEHCCGWRESEINRWIANPPSYRP
jgi:prophage regulatory protein